MTRIRIKEKSFLTEEYDSMTVRVGKLMYEIGYGD